MPELRTESGELIYTAPYAIDDCHLALQAALAIAGELREIFSNRRLVVERSPATVATVDKLAHRFSVAQRVSIKEAYRIYLFPTWFNHLVKMFNETITSLELWRRGINTIPGGQQ